MDQCTHEVCAEYWRNIIKACGQRPTGQSRKSRWMKTGCYWRHVYGLSPPDAVGL